MKKLFYSLILLSAIFFSSCSGKKNNPTPPVQPSKTGSTLDLIKDSVYLYEKEEYLWYASVPNYATVAPRAVTDPSDATALQKLVDKMSQYAINPATNQPYEYYTPSPGEAKYSFIDDGTVSGELNGVNGDYGFRPEYNDINDLRVSYVYPGSPADQKGIKRGYQITSINGNASISYDGSSVGGSGNNLNFVNDAIFNSNTVSMTLLKPDNTTLTVTNLAVANYTVNPVLTYKTFDQGNGHIVGYVVFNTFTSDANADGPLNTAFQYFTTQGVTDLVVDLRYNGGGYVSTAEYIDNLIVPAAKTGTLMYNTYYNDKLQADNHPLLSTIYNIPAGTFKPENNVVNFAKIGSLNVNRVFFIITGSTASASELTINNLRPVMDVQFIGQTSYGKPVGFFALNINKYQYYTPEFYTLNSANQGGYYSGFTPGSASYPGKLDYDDPTKDFGDPTEVLLAHALNYVKTGTYAVKGPVIQSLERKSTFSLAAQNEAALKFASHKFNGMIGSKKLPLKIKR